MANSNVNVIILADDCHKMKFYGNRCLLKINGKTLIELQLEILIPLFSSITVIGGFQFSKLRKVLRDKPVQLIENADFTDLNDSYSLQLALDYLDDKPSLILGNGLFLGKTIIEQLIAKDNQILLENSERDIVSTNINDGQILPFAYGLDYKYIPAIFLNAEVIKLYHKIYKLAWSRIFIFEMINKFINRNMKFNGIFADQNNYIYISNLKDYKKTYEDTN